MKIRLKQPGFETYSAQMGVHFFEDGLTTTDVKPSDAVRLAAQFLCEWEDGTPVSVAQSMLDHAHMTTTTMPREINADEALAKQSDEAAERSAVEAKSNALRDAKVYTREQLDAIADKEGIKGLRVIAAPMGIKGNAINELVAEILAKQG